MWILIVEAFEILNHFNNLSQQCQVLAIYEDAILNKKSKESDRDVSTVVLCLFLSRRFRVILLTSIRVEFGNVCLFC